MKQHRESLPFWQQLNSVFSCSHSNGTSTMIYLCLPYHSILAPDRVTLAVPIPLTVPLNRVHCPKRFIPLPCRMAGRILETELQVALQLISQIVKRKTAYNTYLCNIMSHKYYHSGLIGSLYKFELIITRAVVIINTDIAIMLNFVNNL